MNARAKQKTRRKRPEAVQVAWNTFYKWERAFRRACQQRVRAIERGIAEEDFSGNGALFLSGPGNGDAGDWSLSLEDVEERINEKLAFLSDYLVDISSDGARFMASKASFLQYQHPEHCDKAFGLWFWQDDLEKDMGGGGIHYFGHDVTLFCESIDQIDFGTVRSLLGFDRMLLRRPHGETWRRADLDSAIRYIKRDLAFDGFECRVRSSRGPGLVDLQFAWL